MGQPASDGHFFVSSDEIDAEKAAIYAEANAREYWIVLPEEKRIEMHTRPLEREYVERRAFVFPQVAVSEAFRAFQLNLGTFFPT